jgi:Ca-activated chloride channel family protein
MSGRHISEHKRLPRWSFAVVAVVVVAGVVSAFGVVGWPRSAGGTRADAATPCAHRVTLDVLASPAITSPVQEIATAWLASSSASPERTCVRVSVTGRDDAQAEADLASGAAGATTVWVPGSTIWAQRLSSDLARAGTATTMKLGSSVASSPIVFVAPPGRAGAVMSPAALARSVATGGSPISMPDPVTTAEGVLGLQMLRSLVPRGSAQPMHSLIGLMVVLGTHAIDSPQAGFSQAGKADARPFLASEQAVIATNAAAGRQVADALYPASGVESLDYPVAQLGRPGDDPLLTSTAASFGRVLGGVTAQRVFATYGFRDPRGNPISGARGPGGAPVHALPVPTASETADILRMWSAATEASHTLAVIDVSGSMAEPAGNGRTKIQVAADAAAGAVAYFPDSSAFGLWAFSSDQAKGKPWTELAPVRALGTRSGDATQRQRLIAAAKQLPTLVRGSTALYDTALAAFEQVRNSYDPGKVNSVVLLTDGRNEYARGLGLSRLLTRLRTLTEPARPVPIITVGIGDRADIPTLRKISAVTGGKTYVVHDPDEIRGVFLDAIVQRECRPNCSTGSRGQ